MRDPEFDPFQASLPVGQLAYLATVDLHTSLCEAMFSQYSQNCGVSIPTDLIYRSSSLDFEARPPVPVAIAGADAVHLSGLTDPGPDALHVGALDLFRDGSPYVREEDLAWMEAQSDIQDTPNSYFMYVSTEGRPVLIHHHVFLAADDMRRAEIHRQIELLGEDAPKPVLSDFDILQAVDTHNMPKHVLTDEEIIGLLALLKRDDHVPIFNDYASELDMLTSDQP